MGGRQTKLASPDTGLERGSGYARGAHGCLYQGSFFTSRRFPDFILSWRAAVFNNNVDDEIHLDPFNTGVGGMLSPKPM
jgi:hypothetical protein